MIANKFFKITFSHLKTLQEIKINFFKGKHYYHTRPTHDKLQKQMRRNEQHAIKFPDTGGKPTLAYTCDVWRRTFFISTSPGAFTYSFMTQYIYFFQFHGWLIHGKLMMQRVEKNRSGKNFYYSIVNSYRSGNYEHILTALCLFPLFSHVIGEYVCTEW